MEKSQGSSRNDTKRSTQSCSSNSVEKWKSSSSYKPSSPFAGYHFLKLAVSLHGMSGRNNAMKAMRNALKAVSFFERSKNVDAMSDLVTSLHLLASINCTLGHFEESVSTLKRSLSLCSLENSKIYQHFQAFAGNMQLGDTYTLIGQYNKALDCYHEGLRIQKLVLGDMDDRVADTCLYIAESHLQVMEFREAEELCEQALKIHMEHHGMVSEKQAMDRVFLSLILNGSGKHEKALENLILAREAFSSNANSLELAFTITSIGETYVMLRCYDEALDSYQQSLAMHEALYAKSHVRVGEILISIAQVYFEIENLRECRHICEEALKIYGEEDLDHFPDEIATGLTELAGLFESFGEYYQAIKILQRAHDILDGIPGLQSEVAGIEAQMGVLLHLIGNYPESLMSYESALSKFKCGGSLETTWYLGIIHNHMGLACVGLAAFRDAASHFEEAKRIIEETCGSKHSHYLAVCSNLAGVYDGLGRKDAAVDLLEKVLRINEETLGPTHADVQEDIIRLQDMQKVSAAPVLKKKPVHGLKGLVLRLHSSRK